jgi:hypothetical protein
MPDTYDFSVDMAGIDRQAMLQEASSLLDAHRSHMGGGSRAAVASPEGNLVRDLQDDQASLAAAPDVYRITDKDFLERQRPVPVRFQELSKQFKFFWLRFPVGLMPRRHWAFNRLEVKVLFNPEGAANLRPKAYQILPDKKFQELLKVSDRLEVTLDEHFEFSAKPAVNVGLGKAGASASVDGAAGLKLVAGPFEYRIARAKIDNSGPGLEWVFWRLDGAEFFQENRPDLVAIVQTPKEATEFKVHAAMQAYRYFNTGAADWQEAILGLPARIAEFFQRGAPILDTREYELTGWL